MKPADILFSDEHAARISDFGLASAATQRSEADSVVWGTPNYVALERLSNQPEDSRSDIYSLGATLFHAVAGRPPIEASTNSASVLRELKRRPLDLEALAPDVSPSTARTFGTGGIVTAANKMVPAHASYGSDLPYRRAFAFRFCLSAISTTAYASEPSPDPARGRILADFIERVMTLPHSCYDSSGVFEAFYL